MNVSEKDPSYLMYSVNGKEELCAKFEDGQFDCKDPILRNAMVNLGIQIPPDSRPDYEFKAVVYHSDGALFEKAFKNVYYHLHMKKNIYHWK